MLKVVIADDHAIVRGGLQTLFAAWPDVLVVGEAEDGFAAIALARAHRPDLLVLDVAMPFANGLEVYAEVRRHCPTTAIAVLTGFTSTLLLTDWIAAGVEGLFLKGSDEGELSRGLRLLLDGGKYVCSDVVAQLREPSAAIKLTEREKEVLSLIALGLTTGDIGARLQISPKTVEKYREKLFEKFSVNSATGLLMQAFKIGMFDPAKQT